MRPVASAYEVHPPPQKVGAEQARAPPTQAPHSGRPQGLLPHACAHSLVPPTAGRHVGPAGRPIGVATERHPAVTPCDAGMPALHVRRPVDCLLSSGRAGKPSGACDDIWPLLQTRVSLPRTIACDSAADWERTERSIGERASARGAALALPLVPRRAPRGVHTARGGDRESTSRGVDRLPGSERGDGGR